VRAPSSAGSVSISASRRGLCMHAPSRRTQLTCQISFPSSHKNVHSSVRTHFCPVKGCLRSEGGKGFKRKNEMIRHGLVHKSPGYICPFCPDIERKYPRPDNLQRYGNEPRRAPLRLPTPRGVNPSQP
jgi:hypothetical protein